MTNSTLRKSQKRLDISKECALVCRSVNTSSDRAVENLALKIMELKKRLEGAHNES